MLPYVSNFPLHAFLLNLLIHIVKEALRLSKHNASLHVLLLPHYTRSLERMQDYNPYFLHTV